MTQVDLVSAKEASQIIGITVKRVYLIDDLLPAHDKPRLYHRHDVEKIAMEYKPAGKHERQKRRKPA